MPYGQSNSNEIKNESSVAGNSVSNALDTLQIDAASKITGVIVTEMPTNPVEDTLYIKVS